MRTLSTSLVALATLLSALAAGAQPAGPKPATTAAAQPAKPATAATTPQPAKPVAPQKAVLPRVLSDAMVKVARDLYLQGAEAMAQGRPADARAAFFAALGLNPHYSIFCNLGDADLRLGRATNAAEELAECVPGIEKDAKATEAERAAVRKLFADAKAKLVELVTHSGRVEQMPQVTTFIDADRSSNSDDVTAFLEPGKHVVRFEAEGYVNVAVDFDGPAGSRKEITPTWKKKDVAVVPTASATATAVAPARSLVPAYVLGAAGLAAAAVGGGLLGGYASKRGEVAALYEDILGKKHSCVPGAANFDARCKDVAGIAHTGDDFNRAGIGLLIGGGALAAGGVLYWLWPQRAGGVTAVRITPRISSDGPGIVAGGAW